MSMCSPGLWKVVAKFHSNQNQSYSAEFEVKEYGKSLIVCGHLEAIMPYYVNMQKRRIFSAAQS